VLRLLPKTHCMYVVSSPASLYLTLSPNFAPLSQQQKPHRTCPCYSLTTAVVSLQMIVRVYGDSGGEDDPLVTDVPVTPETTCRDVIECCRDPGDEHCALVETWGSGHGEYRAKAQWLLLPDSRATSDIRHCHNCGKTHSAGASGTGEGFASLTVTG
jgi:hypothetical protein